MSKTAFIGHRQLCGKGIYQRIENSIEEIILEQGCNNFTMGTYGEFDNLALNACRNLRKKYKDINIEIVFTSLHKIDKYSDYYRDVSTVIYEIEDAHFKTQITLSNRLMIDTCDTLICYVDEKKSKIGAKTAMKYAQKIGLKIINLWREEDSVFFGKTKEEIDLLLKEWLLNTDIVKKSNY